MHQWKSNALLKFYQNMCFTQRNTTCLKLPHEDKHNHFRTYQSSQGLTSFCWKQRNNRAQIWKNHSQGWDTTFYNICSRTRIIVYQVQSLLPSHSGTQGLFLRRTVKSFTFTWVWVLSADVYKTHPASLYKGYL